MISCTLLINLEICLLLASTPLPKWPILCRVGVKLYSLTVGLHVFNSLRAGSVVSG